MKKNGFIFCSLVFLAVGTGISGWGLIGERAQHYIAFEPAPIPTSHTDPGFHREMYPGQLAITGFLPEAVDSNPSKNDCLTTYPSGVSFSPSRSTNRIKTKSVPANDFYVGGRGSCPLLNMSFLRISHFKNEPVQA